MSRRFTYTTTLNWGGDTPTAEIEVTVSYLVSWGAPEQGPSYASGGQPADPDEIDDVRLDLVEGKPRPWGMGFGYVTDDEFATDCVEKIEGNAHHLEAMLNEAADWARADEDDAAERRAEDRREMDREDRV
jgi:hypothetical protein